MMVDATIAAPTVALLVALRIRGDQADQSRRPSRRRWRWPTGQGRRQTGRNAGRQDIRSQRAERLNTAAGRKVEIRDDAQASGRDPGAETVALTFGVTVAVALDSPTANVPAVTPAARPLASGCAGGRHRHCAGGGQGLGTFDLRADRVVDRGLRDRAALSAMEDG